MSPTQKITERTIYTTPDGMEFSHYAIAKHHIMVCNILDNCFYTGPKSQHYHTIWELIKHHCIIERDDKEYNQQIANDMFLDNTIEEQEWFKIGTPTLGRIKELLNEY